MTVVVIGAGSAGLSVSSELRLLGVEHVVLERHRVGQAWRDRWDSFTLVTPNWTLDLPGSPYAGRDPEGHVPRDEIVSYLEDYGANHAGTIREGISVQSLDPGRSKRFRLYTSGGPIETNTVVICSGAYQRPHRPAIAAGFPSDVAVLNSTQYRNPSALPDGKVLIVGSGQTGVQLAEELFLSGRDVVLSCGRAPWIPRRLGDKDIVTWLNRTTFFDQPLPAQGARLVANVQATKGGLSRCRTAVSSLPTTWRTRSPSATPGTSTSDNCCGTPSVAPCPRCLTHRRSRPRPLARSTSTGLGRSFSPPASGRTTAAG